MSSQQRQIKNIKKHIRKSLRYVNKLTTRLGIVSKSDYDILLDDVEVLDLELLESIKEEVDNLDNWFSDLECPEYKLLKFLGDNVKINIKELGIFDIYCTPINYIRTYMDYKEIIAFKNPLDCVSFRTLRIEDQKKILDYVMYNFRRTGKNRFKKLCQQEEKKKDVD